MLRAFLDHIAFECMALGLMSALLWFAVFGSF